MRNAKMANGRVTNPSPRYGHRQPSVPPASAAIPPTTAGLSTAASRAENAIVAFVRPRAAIG